MSVGVYPLVSPWGRFGLYSFFIDADEPAVVDTGIASSPAEGMVPALAAIGRRAEDIRWILLTHGHIDHLGGAAALWELTGRRAGIVIHRADADLLRSRRSHVDLYEAVRAQYLNDPEGTARQTAMAETVIAGEVEPTRLVDGGEKLSLGNAQIAVHHIPGHTAGSVAYEILGQGAVFSGDAVQVHGAANGFPGYEDPVAYRKSLQYVLNEVRPESLYMGHPYRRQDGTPYGVELDAEDAHTALTESLAIEARIADAADRCFRQGMVSTDSPYSPFEQIAVELGYTADPRLEPSPFFTTLLGYLQHYRKELSRND